MLYTERNYRHITSLDWKTSHTRRLQAAVHDDKLVVAYDHRRVARLPGPNGELEDVLGCWVLGRLCIVSVARAFGVKVVPETQLLPVVWKEWRDDDKTPLPIEDPRLIPYIRRCDLWTNKAAIIGDLDAADAAEAQRWAKMGEEFRDRAKEIRPAFAKLADELGCVAHRKESNTFTASTLWKRGAGYRKTGSGLLVPSGAVN